MAEEPVYDQHAYKTASRSYVFQRLRHEWPAVLLGMACLGCTVAAFLTTGGLALSLGVAAVGLFAATSVAIDILTLDLVGDKLGVNKPKHYPEMPKKEDFALKKSPEPMVSASQPLPESFLPPEKSWEKTLQAQENTASHPPFKG